MTNIIPATEIQFFQNMSEIDASNAAAQMITLLSALSQEKNDIDSMVSMLERQPWYKKCIFTLLGKNKATVSEIQEHRDMLTAYTSEAIALLYNSSRIQQNQIIALGEAVNAIHGLLSETNVQLIETQNAVNSIKKETFQVLSNLANTLNNKIESVDYYHLLIKEIEQGKYNSDNCMINLFNVISQIDQRTAKEQRKLDVLYNTLLTSNIINESESTLSDYLFMIATLPNEYAGLIYQEVACIESNEFSSLFTKILEKHTFLSKIEKKAKDPRAVIESICKESNMNPMVSYSLIEVFEYFFQAKVQQLLNISIYSNSSSVQSKNENDIDPASETDISDNNNADFCDINDIEEGDIIDINDIGECNFIDDIEGDDIEIAVDNVDDMLDDYSEYISEASLIMNIESVIDSSDNQIIIICDIIKGQIEGGETVMVITNNNRFCFYAQIDEFESLDESIKFVASEGEKIKTFLYVNEKTNVQAGMRVIGSEKISESTPFDNFDYMERTMNKTLDTFNELHDTISQLQFKTCLPIRSFASRILNKDVNAIIDIVDKYIHNIPTSSYYAYDSSQIGSISSYIVNARSKFGHKATGRIIGLVDTSIFGNGKAGLLFTTEGIASKESFSCDTLKEIFSPIPSFIRYDEIQAVRYSDDGKTLYFIGTFKGVEGLNTTPNFGDILYNLPYFKDMIEEIIS